jgi:hypothetical protein
MRVTPLIKKYIDGVTDINEDGLIFQTLKKFGIEKDKRRYYIIINLEKLIDHLTLLYKNINLHNFVYGYYRPQYYQSDVKRYVEIKYDDAKNLINEHKNNDDYKLLFELNMNFINAFGGDYNDISDTKQKLESSELFNQIQKEYKLDMNDVLDLRIFKKIYQVIEYIEKLIIENPTKQNYKNDYNKILNYYSNINKYMFMKLLELYNVPDSIKKKYKLYNSIEPEFIIHKDGHRVRNIRQSTQNIPSIIEETKKIIKEFKEEILQVLPINLLEYLLYYYAKDLNVIFRFDSSFNNTMHIKKLSDYFGAHIIIDASGGRVLSIPNKLTNTSYPLYYLYNVQKDNWIDPVYHFMIFKFPNMIGLSVTPSISKVLYCFKHSLYYYFVNEYKKIPDINFLKEISNVFRKSMNDNNVLKWYPKLKNVNMTKGKIIDGYIFEIIIDNKKIIIYVRRQGIDVKNVYLSILSPSQEVKINDFKFDDGKDITDAVNNELNFNKYNNVEFKKMELKELFNYVADEKTNTYYYKTSDDKEYVYGYITLHGKFYGILTWPEDLNDVKTRNWFTAVGINWYSDDKNQKYRDEFVYANDYIAIALDKNTFHTLTKKMNGLKKINKNKFQLLGDKKLIDIFQSVGLLENINTTFKLYDGNVKMGDKYVLYNKKNQLDLNSVLVSMPFEIRPKIRMNYSDPNFKFDKNDSAELEKIYLITGDGLLTPHFYGAGGFLRGAEITSTFIDLLNERIPSKK